MFGSKGLDAEIDGDKWSATMVVMASHSNDVLSVTGSDAGAKQMHFSIQNFNGEGTYTVGPGNQDNMLRWTAGLNPEDSYIANFQMGSGTIEVTEITDARTIGTFSFTGENTNGDEVVVTAGEFDAEIEQ